MDVAHLVSALTDERWMQRKRSHILNFVLQDGCFMPVG